MPTKAQFASNTAGTVDVLTLDDGGGSSGRPATASGSVSREGVRTHTRNVHAVPPISYDDKVLREKRSDDFELPEWQVCRSKTKVGLRYRFQSRKLFARHNLHDGGQGSTRLCLDPSASAPPASQ